MLPFKFDTVDMHKNACPIKRRLNESGCKNDVQYFGILLLFYVCPSSIEVRVL